MTIDCLTNIYRFFSNRCDFTCDCSDCSDENATQCGSYRNGCNYEYSLTTCGIKTDVQESATGDTESNLEWNIKQGQNVQTYYDPLIDNTK